MLSHFFLIFSQIFDHSFPFHLSSVNFYLLPLNLQMLFNFSLPISLIFLSFTLFFTCCCHFLSFLINSFFYCFLSLFFSLSLFFYSTYYFKVSLSLSEQFLSFTFFSLLSLTSLSSLFLLPPSLSQSIAISYFSLFL